MKKILIILSFALLFITFSRSVSAVPWLHTSGNELYDSDNNKFRLYTVSTHTGQGWHITQQDIQNIKSWGFAGIRFHITWGGTDGVSGCQPTPSSMNLAAFTTGTGQAGNNAVDDIVNWCRDAGLYVILGTGWSGYWVLPNWAKSSTGIGSWGDDGTTKQYIDLLNNTTTQAGVSYYYSFLANRYASYPNVIFETFNELASNPLSAADQQKWANYNNMWISAIETNEGPISHIKILDLLYDNTYNGGINYADTSPILSGSHSNVVLACHTYTLAQSPLSEIQRIGNAWKAFADSQNRPLTCTEGSNAVGGNLTQWASELARLNFVGFGYFTDSGGGDSQFYNVGYSGSRTAILNVLQPYMLNSTNIRISGTLVDKNNITVNANISAYQQGTNSIVNSTQTTNGNYDLYLPYNVYDLQYSPLNFFISNFFIRLLSLSISSSLVNKVNYITNVNNQNVLFGVDVNANQIIQTYSPQRPSRVLANGTPMENVSSYSQLTSNTWFYNSTENRLYMIPPIFCSCTNWANQGCNLGGCSNQMYQTRNCNILGCGIMSQCISNASCTVTCPDGACASGENCQSDSIACSEPALCYLRTCNSGCNNPASPVPSGQQDTDGYSRCDDSAGCSSPPCQCDGYGSCVSKPYSYIFSDGFESGDFSKWSGSQVHSGSTAAVQSTKVHSGTFAGNSTLASSMNNAYAYYSMPGMVATAYGRMYVNYAGFPTLGDAVINDWFEGSGTSAHLAGLGVKNVAGTTKFYFIYVNNGAYTSATIDSPLPILNTWYSFEVKSTISSTVGEARGYINGTEDFTYTGLNNGAEYRIANFNVGLRDDGYTSGSRNTLYDDAIVSSYYIGP